MASEFPLISFDGLQTILQRMQAHIAAQDARMTDLAAQVQQLKRGEDRVIDMQNALQSVVTDVKRLVAYTQIGTEDGSESDTPPLRSLLAAITARLAGLESIHEVQQRDERRSVERAEEIKKELFIEFNNIKNNYAPRSSVLALHSSNEALTSNVALLSSMLASKVDKSEVHSLQSLVAEVSSYADWRQAASEDIAKLHAETAHQSADLAQTRQSLHDLTRQVGDLETEQQGKADRIDVDALQSYLRRVDAQLGEKATTTALQEAVQWIQSNNVKADAMELNIGHIENMIHEQYTHVRELIEGVQQATMKNNQDSAADLRQAITNLRRELEARAFVTSLEATDENVTVLSEASSALARKVDVCLKFIEWFTDKGEAYTYNAAALERHMNALAIGNRSKVGDPPGSVASNLSSTTHAPFKMPADVMPSAGPTTGERGVRIGGTVKESKAAP